MEHATNSDRRRFLSTSAFALAGAGLAMPWLRRAMKPPANVLTDDTLAALGGATAWINSGPLNAAALRGTVVVLDIWTYTCINWLRTLPYVRAWEQRYRAQGLVVIGVHSPEFAFERSLENVRKATTAMGITYPVAIDNDFAIWRALSNRYWPSLYVIGADGDLLDRQFGEGKYKASERAIRSALQDAGPRDIGAEVGVVAGKGAEAPPDWRNLKSPETYVGYDQFANFESSIAIARDKCQRYELPPQLRTNHWALSGDWTVQHQSIVLKAHNGRIRFRFHARDVHLVMGPATAGRAVRFDLSLDGRAPGLSHGSDVDSGGRGLVLEQRLYQLIRQTGPIVDREVTIQFLGEGAELFVFTFG